MILFEKVLIVLVRIVGIVGTVILILLKLAGIILLISVSLVSFVSALLALCLLLFSDWTTLLSIIKNIELLVGAICLTINTILLITVTKRLITE